MVWSIERMAWAVETIEFPERDWNTPQLRMRAHGDAGGNDWIPWKGLKLDMLTTPHLQPQSVETIEFPERDWNLAFATCTSDLCFCGNDWIPWKGLKQPFPLKQP